MGPVKDHVACIFEDIMVRMPKDMNVAVTWLSFWAELVESMFGVSGIACQGLGYLLVNNHVDLHPSFCRALYDLIDTPLLIEVGRSPKEQLGRQPPIFYVDCLFRPFHCH